TRSDLQIALRRLVADRERGAVPHFGRVLIETSGLVDLSPILQTFSTDRALGSEFSADVVLAVVDAVNGARNLATAPEARKQVILSDRIVLSKTDLTKPAPIKTLARQIKKLNPRATIETATEGKLDPHCLTELQRPSRTVRALLAEATHSDGIESFVL